MSVSRGRLLVFARAPVPGETKTRLVPALGARGAAQLHAHLVTRTLATACRAALAPVELWCSPRTDAPFFLDCEQRFALSLHTQRGADLGARMAHALEEALQRADHAVLIGTDCPDLSPDELASAFSHLEAGADAVLGPALDGGYWLIGVRRLAAGLFMDMPWGTDKVLSETRARLKELHWRWEELPVLRDIDTAEDLAFLPPECQRA